LLAVVALDESDGLWVGGARVVEDEVVEEEGGGEGLAGGGRVVGQVQVEFESVQLHFGEGG